MDIQSWTWLIVGLSFALYIGIAIATRVRSTSGFYVAGHGVPALFNGMATGADWMSAASFISMAGIISFTGYTGSVYLIGWTGGYVLLALLLAPYLRKFGKFTVPDFVGDRYYSDVARLVAVFCAIFVSFTYVAGQMRGVGVVFSRFLEVEINTGVIIGMVLVFIYATLGGMKGITYTQVAQYVVLIVAYLIPAIAISHVMTGQWIPQLGFGAKVVRGDQAGLSVGIDQIHRDLGFRNTLPPLCRIQIHDRHVRRDSGTHGRDTGLPRHYPLLHGQERSCRQVERILGITFYRYSLHDSTRHCDICTGEFDSDSPRKGLH